MKKKQLLHLIPIPIWIGFLLFSCTTVDYRGVQSRFEQAVQLDNGRSVSAFTESSVFTEPGYEEVLAQLTPEYIEGLDPRLRPNAWLLRAVSQWRTDRLKEARESAAAGLSEPVLQKQSRDHILLLMIPAFVIDMEIEKDWRQSGRRPAPGQYAGLARNYQTVFDLFTRAEQAMGQASPPSVRFYLNYQKWRVIQGWRSVVNSIDAGTDREDEIAQVVALEEAKRYFGGKSLKDMAVEQENGIPAGHPLRSLIAAQSR